VGRKIGYIGLTLGVWVGGVRVSGFPVVIKLIECYASRLKLNFKIVLFLKVFNKKK
jgi:hypothetical protein